MSDASSDISRDQQRFDIENEIEKAESAFFESPSHKKAEELIKLWKKYVHMPSGYWSSSNESLAHERIALYDLYIKTNKIPVFPILSNDKSQLVIDKVIRVGNGFIVNGLDNIILNQIFNKTNINPSLKKFRIRLVLEEAEEITCSICPFMHRNCSIGCKSMHKEELKERRELAEKGKYLVKEGSL